LIMRDSGPEPVIVQIKQSLRSSDDLDNRLTELAAVRGQNHLGFLRVWAGDKLLYLISFPPGLNEAQATAIVQKLKQCPAVEKVVAVSAANLEFRTGDFARAYTPDERIPDVAMRGFDAARIKHRQQSVEDISGMLLAPHAPNRLIVRWKDEYAWKADQNGFRERIAALHREAGCRLLREDHRSATRLVHVLEFDDARLLADKLKKYIESGLVVYAQPDFIYKPLATPNDPAYNGAPGPQWSLPLISAPQAWDITTGSHDVIIAVGDSGAPVDGPPAFPRTPHPDFAANLWDGQNLGTDVHNLLMAEDPSKTVWGMAAP
jgi:hypothetical protein